MNAPIALPNLRHVRTSKGFSQTRLAAESVVPLTALRAAENGGELARARAAAIASTLGVGLARLAGWRGITVPTRHPEFGYSNHGNGVVLHRVQRAFIVWKGGKVDSVEAEWACGVHRHCFDVTLTDDTTAARWCPHCDIGAVQQSPSVVYAGVRDGQLKVGCTRNLSTRLAAQGLTLIAQAPGSYFHEGQLLQRLGPPLRRREWFRWDGGAALLITGWMVSRRNSEAA